jgi:hypothetical protein
MAQGRARIVVAVGDGTLGYVIATKDPAQRTEAEGAVEATR